MRRGTKFGKGQKLLVACATFLHVFAHVRFLILTNHDLYKKHFHNCSLL
jgi:hypothetical protein